jgi:hypothetical protein
MNVIGWIYNLDLHGIELLLSIFEVWTMKKIMATMGSNDVDADVEEGILDDDGEGLLIF